MNRAAALELEEKYTEVSDGMDYREWSVRKMRRPVIIEWRMTIFLT